VAPSTASLADVGAVISVQATASFMEPNYDDRPDPYEDADKCVDELAEYQAAVETVLERSSRSQRGSTLL
jgi:hypothetical protein